MTSAFYKLDNKKQERIINASLNVFSKNSFKNGSTDIIAYQAQISKGSLFHYFKNKKSLYLFVYHMNCLHQLNTQKLIYYIGMVQKKL